MSACHRRASYHQRAPMYPTNRPHHTPLLNHPTPKGCSHNHKTTTAQTAVRPNHYLAEVAKSCQSKLPTSRFPVTFESSAISFVLITLTIKGPPVCIIHDTAALMSEIKCNKLEITSLRQCDSIKIRGNIGPCIIEGPARQDSCQACQPRCSYWIWPVTHTQIKPVKITGYIDFLILFANACEWESSCMHACVHIRLHVCIIVCACTACGCAHMCLSLRVRYKSGVGDHPGVESRSHIWSCKLEPAESFRCWAELRRAVGTRARLANRMIIANYYSYVYSKIIRTSTSIQLCSSLQNVCLLDPFVYTHVWVQSCACSPWIQHVWGFEGTLHTVPRCRCCVYSPHYASAAVTNKYTVAHRGDDKS